MRLLSTKRSNGNSWQTPPNPDQIELTLFGPGFGECGVVHIGSNRWIVVDSCIFRSTGKPVALEYFRALGIEPGKSVELIVATHWHDDHIRGMSQLLEGCSAARFSCSAAMTRLEFESMVQAFDSQRMVRASSGVSEVNKVFQMLSEGARPTARRASAGRMLMQMEGHILAHGQPVRCMALSPSDYEEELAILAIGAMLPRVKETQYRCPAQEPNLMALAVHLTIGNVHMLLGADLEQHNDNRRGWGAVLSDTSLPKDRSCIFKMPHHGAMSGFSSEVWDTLLETKPLAVTTPWQLGGNHLPTNADIDRIILQTPHGFLTSNPLPSRSHVVGRAPMVERQLREMGVRLRQVESPIGAVRLRNGGASAPEDWSAELRGAAIELTN